MKPEWQEGCKRELQRLKGGGRGSKTRVEQIGWTKPAEQSFIEISCRGVRGGGRVVSGASEGGERGQSCRGLSWNRTSCVRRARVSRREGFRA